jgi:hypothetical protein
MIDKLSQIYRAICGSSVLVDGVDDFSRHECIPDPHSQHTCLVSSWMCITGGKEVRRPDFVGGVSQLELF